MATVSIRIDIARAEGPVWTISTPRFHGLIGEGATVGDAITQFTARATTIATALDGLGIDPMGPAVDVTY